MCDLVRDYCLLGATNVDIERLLEIPPATLQNWRTRYPEFRAAIQEGRDEADSRVAKSLFHRALGARVQETHVAVINGHVIQTPITRCYPPDTAAAFIWLKNRQPRFWRDKTPDGQELSPDEAAAEVRKIIAQAQATSNVDETDD